MKKDSSVSKTRHYGFVIVFCCCLMMGINVGFAFSCAGIFYQPVSESLGVSVGEFGIYMSIMYITSTLMLPIGGRMLERFSARLLFSVSAVLMGCCFLSMALANHLWQFYLAGGILGLTLAFLLYLSYPTMVNRWFKTNVGMMVGICCAASGIGGVVFNPIAGWIITQWGWRWGYGIFALIILVAVVPLLALLLRDYPADKGLLPYGADQSESDSTTTGNDNGITYKRAIRTAPFYVMILFAFLIMGISTLNLFIPGYVSNNSFTLEQASMAASAVMIGVTVGKIALGYINDRNCRLGVFITTISGALGLFLLLIGHSSIAVILIGSFLFGWAYAGVTVQTAMLTLTTFGRREYGRIYSDISIALAAGGALASGGWGLLADATSTQFIFRCGIAALILCLFLGLYTLNRRLSVQSSDHK